MRDLVRSVWRIVRGDRLALTGLVLLGAIILTSALAPVIATHDPNAINERVEGIVIAYDDEWGEVTVVADQPLNAATLVGPDEGFAVGEGGRIAALIDGTWTDLDPPLGATLRGIDNADGLVVAVGDAGAIAHHTGEGWDPVDAGTDETLYDVAVAAPDHALAVGADGTALRWDGARWTGVRTDTDADLHGVRLAADGSGVAVGSQGTVLAYSGQRFSRVDGAGFRDLHGVDVDGDELIAVGERGTILRYDGDGWETMRSPETRTLADVRYLEEGALAVGDRGVALLLAADDVWESSDTGYGRALRGLGAADGRIVAVGTDPYVNELAEPSSDHYFGTTHLGRDIFSQTIWGSRTALLVGFLAAIMVTVIGTNVGLIAGYFKGKTGGLLMRFVDVMYALPFEPFALVLVLIFRPSLAIVVLAIGLLTWRTTARLIRSQVLSLSERPFVKAARVAGASDWRILYIHIAPNVLPLAFLQLAVAMAFAITAEATLSFLGLGPPQVYSWGGILHEARLSGAWRTAWWWIIPPGLFIMVTVVAVFFISRALEVLTNPRLATERRGA